VKLKNKTFSKKLFQTFFYTQTIFLTQSQTVSLSLVWFGFVGLVCWISLLAISILLHLVGTVACGLWELGLCMGLSFL